MTPDIGLLAGLLARTRPPAERDAELLTRVLGPRASSHLAGDLAIAWTGDRLALDGDRLCALGGHLYGGPDDPENGPADPARAVLTAWPGGAAPPPAWLRGDIGLVCWDTAQRRGILAVDQMGGRALFWHDDGTVLRFASEVNLLLGLLPQRPGPDPHSLAHWIGMIGYPEDRTIYAGIHRLGAGRMLEIAAARRSSARRWWNPAPAMLDVDREGAVELMRATLTRSVARRTSGGERTAVLLSGGLDSSAVGGIARSLGPPRAPRRSYSAVFPDHPTVDESELIGQLADRLELASTRAVVRSGSVLAGALPYLERWAVPPVSPNLFFWAPLLEQASADGVEVLLDGEGGDEMLALSPYLTADRLLRGRVGAAADLRRRIPHTPPGVPRAQLMRWLFQYGVLGAAPAWTHALSRRVKPAARYMAPWVRPETARAFVASADGADWKRASGPRWRRWLVYATSTGQGPALLYDHSRHRAQQAGLESRHPIADPDVLELVLALPPELSYDTAGTRPLAREAVRGLIPEAVRMRRGKSTFDAIFHDSLAGPDLPVARTFLGPGARLGEYVDLERMGRALLEEVPAPGLPRQGWAIQLWRLLNAECWLRFQEEPAAPRRTAEQIGLPVAECSIVADARVAG